MTSSTAESCAFVRTDSGKPAPDLQFMVIPALMRRKGLPDPTRPGMSMAATLVDVASRGRITLSSDRPDVAPTIEARYLSEPADVLTLLAGIDLARDIASRGPLRSYLAEECLAGAIDTPTLLNRYLQSIYHPTSSVAMGPNDDDPLDLELRVRGIDRLRVVDASAMPAIPRGNTNAPTIALAERAVDLIRGASAQPRQHTEQIAEFAGGAL
jgi:choline dehydrogenase